MGDIGKKYPIIKGKDDFYTIKSWIEIVYPGDTAELEEELREIYRRFSYPPSEMKMW